VLERGILDIINEAKEKELSSEDKEKKDFYKAVQLSLSGILSYAENLSKFAKKMAEKERQILNGRKSY